MRAAVGRTTRTMSMSSISPMRMCTTTVSADGVLVSASESAPFPATGLPVVGAEAEVSAEVRPRCPRSRTTDIKSVAACSCSVPAAGPGELAWTAAWRAASRMILIMWQQVDKQASKQVRSR